MAHADTILYNALKVITEDPVIRSYLERNDPMALRQALDGIKTFDEENTPKTEYVVDLFVPFSCVPPEAESAEQAEAMARAAFIADNLYDRLVEQLGDTVFDRSDSEWKVEVGEG